MTDHQREPVMTGDLRVLLLVAIENTKTAIDQYVAHCAGTGGPCLNYEGQDPEDYIDFDSCWVHIQTSEASPYRDVEFGLRRCSADLRALERHTPELIEGRNADGDEREGYFCRTCDMEWPCPDLVDLAYVYKIEVVS